MSMLLLLTLLLFFFRGASLHLDRFVHHYTNFDFVVVVVVVLIGVCDVDVFY